MRILAALAAAVAGLAVAAGIIGGSVMGASGAGHERSAVLDAARQEVLDIVTISPGSLNGDLGRIIGGATGEFKSEISSQKSPFINVIKQQKVSSAGSISAAGIESVNGDNASVLVAAAATVKNSQSPAGAARDYRMQVTMQKVNGQWLASQVEFVP